LEQLLEQLSALNVHGHREISTEPTAGTIFDIVKYSTHDGPGIRTAVYFKGCPLQCWWCHNPEGQLTGPQQVYREDRCIRCYSCVEACPNHAIKILDGTPTLLRDICTLSGLCVQACQTRAREIAGRQVSVSDVMGEVEKDTVFYEESGGGVTFSGGEPFMQLTFLQTLLAACKGKGIRTAVETCGFVNTETLMDSSTFVDLYLYDLKAIDDETHRKFTGVSNDLILRNLRQLSQVHDQVIVRFPIIPGVNDDDANVLRLGKFVSSLRGVKEIDVLPYHKLGIEKYKRLGMVSRMSETEPPSKTKMDGIVGKLESFGLTVKVGG
jgi:pyruvate formate lyase activating enzyme